MVELPLPATLTQAVQGSRDARRVADLLTLLEVSGQLSASTELSPLLRAIELASLRVLDCERTTIFLYDSEGDELVSRIATGDSEIRFPSRRGIAGEAFHGNKVLNIADAYADNRFNRDIDRATGYTTRNMLSAPLLGLNGKAIGVLQVLNKRNRTFDAWDEDLVRTFSALAGIAVQRQMLLDEFTIKQRMQQELQTARSIQQRLLPTHPPQVPGYDIAGWNEPATETGGDFYDFQELASGAVAVALADVSGHGIGPALIASECRALFRACLSLTQHLERVMALVNDLLVSDLPDDRFVTAFTGLLMPSDHRFAYISAGHGPLLHFHAGSNTISELSTSGPPLGILPRKSYELSRAIVLEPGDLLLFLTDGLVEWPDPKRDRFGCERVVPLVQKYHRRPGIELIRILYEAARDFSRGVAQADDVTAVIVKRLG